MPGSKRKPVKERANRTESSMNSAIKGVACLGEKWEISPNT